jgi:lipoprotein-anchoring transpeptidase ErfK/SrfK
MFANNRGATFMTHPIFMGEKSKKASMATSLILFLVLLSMLLSACGGAPSTQPQAMKDKKALDTQLAYAHSLGVPVGLLQPIMSKEKTLSQGAIPSSYFSNQPATDYYANLSKQYKSLANQIPPLTVQANVVTVKLKQFTDTIDTMQQYGMDTNSVQQQLTSEKTTLSAVKTLSAYNNFPARIDSDITAQHDAMIKGEAKYRVQQYDQEVTNWGNANKYHNALDNQDYTQDYSYDNQVGIGTNLDTALSSAQSLTDYQSVLTLAKNDMTGLQSMEADYKDTTPVDQPHATDAQMMQYYNVTADQVIVVSLAQQSLRLYQNGKLVRGFYITAGRPGHPSLPGLWSVDMRLSPTVFKSGALPGSDDYYPDTPINYAIGYWGADGYFLHDSWWRQDYGPHTNYPHYDSGGDSFADDGSHGCVNMPEAQAAWMYANTDINTKVIIY